MIATQGSWPIKDGKYFSLRDRRNYLPMGLQEQLVSLLGLFVELRRLVEVQFRRAIVHHVEILLPRFTSCM